MPMTDGLHRRIYTSTADAAWWPMFWAWVVVVVGPNPLPLGGPAGTRQVR